MWQSWGSRQMLRDYRPPSCACQFSKPRQGEEVQEEQATWDNIGNCNTTLCVHLKFLSSQLLQISQVAERVPRTSWGYYRCVADSLGACFAMGGSSSLGKGTWSSCLTWEEMDLQTGRFTKNGKHKTNIDPIHDFIISQILRQSFKRTCFAGSGSSSSLGGAWQIKDIKCHARACPTH